MRDRIRRLPFAIAGLFLLASLALPLWYTHMEAAQYKGDEALLVEVYASHVDGDLDEIRVLNTYVGVHLPEDFQELVVVPWVIGGMAALALLGAAVPARLRRWVAVTLILAFVGFAGVGTYVLYQRLHTIGHDRTRSPFARVDDFMPPLIGTRKIANFTVHTGLDSGGWAIVGAFVASGLGLGMGLHKNGGGD